MADPVRVFLSYSSKDADLVDRLKTALAQAGVDVWLDHEQLKPGMRNWQVKVREGIAQAMFIVYAASETAAQSDYVYDEIDIAREKGKTVIPFWIRGKDWHDCVPIGFGATQRIDARGAAYAGGLAELIDALTILPSGGPAASFQDTYLLGHFHPGGPIIWFDSLHNLVSVKGKVARLTPTESRILQVLAANSGHVCTMNQIAEHAWGYGHEGDINLIKAHVKHLREKIEKKLSKPRYIITAPDGVGYILWPYDFGPDPD